MACLAKRKQQRKALNKRRGYVVVVRKGVRWRIGLQTKQEEKE